ncbi:MAG: acyl-CoA synthetase FdrA [Deltaproteobacteria bacterium]|nr:acyl-CoA synthetase FdrA [Deltaproteobacteria bacterium]
MAERTLVRKNTYRDSAFLMRIGRRVAALPGLAEAVVLMATEMNRRLLEDAGFAPEAFADAGPMDIVVALRAENAGQLDAAEREALELLERAPVAAGAAARTRPGSVREAVAERPSLNLASIAVPGPYAAFLAHQALDAGRHVFLFSDNVPLEDEVALKRRAAKLGLLVMGPDCGTAIVAGTGLGFANRVPRGSLGIVGASGTGVQEISCLAAAAGEGISQAIGTGGRDLSAAVGGAMTEQGARLLAVDPGTKVLAVAAKHPADEVAARLHEVLRGLGKPVVVRWLGAKDSGARDGVHYAGSLDEAAAWAVALARGKTPAPLDLAGPAVDAAKTLLDRHGPVRGRAVGLFGGGSLAAEARLLFEQAGVAVEVPTEELKPGRALPGADHLMVDVGDDVYTVGRPHPMVDQTVRCGLIRAVGADASVGLLLLDVVLGDGAHLDPAPELAAAVQAARQARGGRPLVVVASLCGTLADPQGLERQRGMLFEAQIHVEPSGARAAAAAAALLAGTETGGGRP